MRTSGATEANNTVIHGLMEVGYGHVVSTAIEHASVLGPLAATSQRGLAVSLVAPMATGVVDPAAVEAALRPETGLISVMAVNNEIGTVQPVEEIAAIARERRMSRPFPPDSGRSSVMWRGSSRTARFVTLFLAASISQRRVF
jgi:cysteine desulfurase